MTPAARHFIEAMRDAGGFDEGCALCGGALDDDSGECVDCGTDFERKVGQAHVNPATGRRFWPGPRMNALTCEHTYGYTDADGVVVCGECGIVIDPDIKMKEV